MEGLPEITSRLGFWLNYSQDPPRGKHSPRLGSYPREIIRQVHGAVCLRVLISMSRKTLETFITVKH